jgi:hypothetical protein
MKAKRRVRALGGGQSDNLAARAVRSDRILLRRASMRRKIALESPGNLLVSADTTEDGRDAGPGKSVSWNSEIAP